MFGPTTKYNHLTVDPIDGKTKLYWQAHPEGYPVRAGGPMAIDREAAKYASVEFYARSKVLEIPAQLDEYVAVVDWIANGSGVLRYEERLPSPDKPGTWFVWITWIDVRGTFPSRPPAYAQPPQVPRNAV